MIKREFLIQNTTISFLYTWIQNNIRNSGGNPSILAAIMFYQIAIFFSVIFTYWISEIGRWAGFVITISSVLTKIYFYDYKHLKHNSNGG
jgi:hypothetical protein